VTITLEAETLETSTPSCECGATLPNMTSIRRGRCERCHARWRRGRLGHCSYCGTNLDGEAGPSHERCKAGRRAIWHKYKAQIFAAYGGICACCGEDEPSFLSIDHVHGGGNAHRREVGGGNRRMMLQIIKAGYPPEYQLLCFNCNCGRALNGGVCPHQAKPGALNDAGDDEQTCHLCGRAGTRGFRPDETGQRCNGRVACERRAAPLQRGAQATLS
jgi:hypothetical protein